MATSEKLSGTLPPKQSKALHDSGKVRLVDVREPSEFAAGHIAGAELIPLGTLGEKAAGWPRETAVLVYCQSGRRSLKAIDTLKQLGFESVADIGGGISGWGTAGLPVEKAKNAPWSLERQVRFTVGLFVIAFTALGLWVHPGFFVLNFLIAAGLIFSAVTNTCGLALVLTKLPWNQVKPS